jgi:hypothetical protein
MAGLPTINYFYADEFALIIHKMKFEANHAL